MQAEPTSRELGRLSLNGRVVEYRVRTVASKSRLRIRIGIGGVEVLQPDSRESVDVEAFMHTNADWVIAQLDRTDRLRAALPPSQTPVGEILFRGVPTEVDVDDGPSRRGSNRVLWDGERIVVARGRGATTTAAQTLENWLRRQARAHIAPLVIALAAKLDVAPGRIYIMDQRTKWGNCSTLRNLSFNWRIILAPDAVLHYLVAHETVHLAVPDHSHKFWLTVQSVCPESERARQWLVANGQRLLVDLDELVQRARTGTS
jgi:predicted metal-dependent hydrolase